MLIHLDGSAAADVTSGSVTAKRSHVCIENLLLAHFEENHVISLLPNDAEILRAASPAWASRARRALDHVDETYPQIAGLRDEITWSIELGLGPDFEGNTLDVAGGRKILRASLHHFEPFRRCECSALLGENGDDADFFRELGLMKRVVRRWEGVEMVHAARGTGGSTFAQELNRTADQGQILFAIADSDKRYPQGGFGGTYTKIKEEFQGRPGYQRARPLPTRTVEALVPPAVYREACMFPHDQGDKRLEVVSRLKELLRSAPSDMFLYADFKNGITCTKPITRRTK